MGNQCNTCQTKVTREGDGKVSYDKAKRKSTGDMIQNTKQKNRGQDVRRGSDVSSSYGGSSSGSTVTMDDFRKIKVVGRGAYGKVYLVQHNYTDKIFAMKAVKKELVIKTDQLEGIKCKYFKKCSNHYFIDEREIMEKFNHPFIMKLQFAF